MRPTRVSISEASCLSDRAATLSLAERSSGGVANLCATYETSHRFLTSLPMTMTTMKRIVRPRVIVGLAVTSCLLLAACSSESEGSENSAADSAAAAETESETETDAAEDTDSSDDEAQVADDSEAPGVASEADGAPIALSSTDRLGSYTLSDDEFGTMVTVTVDGSTRTIETNGLPDRETGEFPNGGNPNTITAQALTWEFPVSPVFTGSATEARTPGVAVNGVKFEPGTAETLTCNSGESYRIEGLQDVHDLGMDFNNAHVQPDGEYHYHGISQMLADAYAGDDDLVHIGFAADGYLMYYAKSGAYESSYALSTTARTGTDCIASGPDSAAIDIDGTAPDGTYTSDWIYNDGAGDLDRCNGTTIDGQYAYLVTDTYPYVSRCLNGEVAAEGAGGGGAAPPDLTEVATALGVTAEQLEQALGGPPPWDLEAVAEALDVTVADLEAVLPTAPGQ